MWHQQRLGPTACPSTTLKLQYPTLQIVREAYPDHTQWDSKSDYYDASSSRDKPKWFMVDCKLVGCWVGLGTHVVLICISCCACCGRWLQADLPSVVPATGHAVYEEAHVSTPQCTHCTAHNSAPALAPRPPLYGYRCASCSGR